MTGYFVRKPNTLSELQNLSGYEDFGKIKKVAQVTLDDKRFDFFCRHLDRDYDFIKKSTDKTGVDNGVFKCILVFKKGTKNTAIAVQSDGSNYARYAAFVNV